MTPKHTCRCSNHQPRADVHRRNTRKGNGAYLLLRELHEECLLCVVLGGCSRCVCVQGEREDQGVCHHCDCRGGVGPWWRRAGAEVQVGRGAEVCCLRRVCVRRLVVVEVQTPDVTPLMVCRHGCDLVQVQLRRHSIAPYVKQVQCRLVFHKHCRIPVCRMYSKYAHLAPPKMRALRHIFHPAKKRCKNLPL